MLIRKATPRDVEAADEIYRAAREFMKETGNPNQWKKEYPSGLDVLQGIEDGTSYVCEEEGEVVATFYFKIGRDSTYDYIEGAWRTNGEYAVIHRIAVKYHGRRIAEFIYSECAKLYPIIRIDTHRDNVPMQRSLSKNGFMPCGIIYLESGEERLAFERCDK